jgi:predicted amidohydrolase
VAKTPGGVEKANKSLADIGGKYSMTVLMANCIGECDGEEGGGMSAIWNNKGELLEQLNDTNEGILMIDTATQEITVQVI